MPGTSAWTTPQPIDPDNLVIRALTLQGTADYFMNVNGSVTPQVFEYVSDHIDVAKIIWWMTDSGIKPDLFGGRPRLTNGLIFEILRPDDTVSKFLPVYANQDLMQIGADLQVFFPAQPAFAPHALSIAWSLADTGRLLHLAQGWKIRVTVQDDLTGLTNFTTWIVGAADPIH